MQDFDPPRHTNRPDADRTARKNGPPGRGPMLLSVPRNGNGTSPNRLPDARPQYDLSLEDAVTLLRTGLKIVRSRWIYGAVAALLVAGVLGYFVMDIKEEETAVTTMLARSPLDQVLGRKPDSRAASQEHENFLRNHISVLQSRRFTVRLANSFSDAEMQRIMAPYLAPAERPTRSALEKLLSEKITADRERGREFFTLAVHHVDGDVAVLVADRITSVYLNLVQAEMQQANAAAATLLRGQAQQLQEEIESLEEQQRVYRETHDISLPGTEAGILAERQKRIEAELAATGINRLKLETQLKEALADMESSPTPFHNPFLASFGNSQNLRADLLQFQADREVLASRYGPNHPKMRDVDASIRGIRENLARNFQLAYQELERRTAEARITEERLQAEYAATTVARLEKERLAVPYLALVDEIEAKRLTLDDLLRRVNEAGVVSQLPTDVMRVVDPAYLSSPRITKRTLAGAFTFLFAVMAFVGVPLTLHLFDDRLKSATDVEKELGKELLGGVPRLHRTRAESRAHIVRENGDPTEVEAFMALVAQIEIASAFMPPKVFLVTSTISGEGKSTIVSNLASGFTSLGKRTAILDCDFRRPTQHELHGVPNDRGLLAWAAAGHPQEGLFEPGSILGIRTLSDGTDLIPAGGQNPKPTHFLLSPETGGLINALQERYDLLIIDTPPAGLFQDALVLSRHAHESILVARERRASVAQVRRAISDLDKTSAPVLGLILNDFSFLSLNPRLAYGSPYKRYGYNGTTRSAVSKPRSLTSVR